MGVLLFAIFLSRCVLVWRPCRGALCARVFWRRVGGWVFASPAVPPGSITCVWCDTLIGDHRGYIKRVFLFYRG